MSLFPDHALRGIMEINRRCRKIRDYITKRIQQEKERLIHIYDFLDDFSRLMDRNMSAVDYIIRKVSEKGVRLTTSSELIYENGGYELVISYSLRWITIDGWLRVFIKTLGNMKKIHYDYLGGISSYSWLLKKGKFLESKKFDINAIADWYVEGIRKIESVLPNSINELLRRDKESIKVKEELEERLKRLVMKWLLPYYLEFLDFKEKHKNSDEKVVLEDFFTSTLRNALALRDGDREVKIRLSYYDDLELKFHDLKEGYDIVSISILLSRDGVNVYVTMPYPYTDRERIEWFIKYLEDRLPKINKGFEMEARRMGECMGILDRLIRKNPEIFL